jgi:acetate kinase
MNKYTLVLNAGSSSLKYKLFRVDVEIIAGQIESIGRQGTSTVKKGAVNVSELIHAKDHLEAVHTALDIIKKEINIEDIDNVLHRVVHGGEQFTHHTVIDNEVEKEIDALSVLAPLHNPANLAGIRAARKMLPHATHIAFFDTAFHHSIPQYAFLYGLPYSLYEKYGIRKYGFHGLSHEYLSEKVYEITKRNDRIISCHLGSGSSVTAMHNGKSIDTTMGFTPLDGLIMATRSGELDPEIPLFLIEHEHMTTKEVNEMLNKEAGMKGLVGTGDLRDIKTKADAGDELAQMVIEMLCYRVATAIGGYHVAVGGVHTLVFTGGIGQNADYVRKEICRMLEPLGVVLNDEANKRHETLISSGTSRVTVLVIPANEELHMVRLLLAGHYSH